MSATVTVTGNLGHTPEIRQAGRSNVLELNIAATHAQKDKQSGQWADEGDPLWIKAPFWNDKADYIADMGLVKGARVTVEGTLIRRDHPRLRGEHSYRSVGMCTRGGSSPPARGALWGAYDLAGQTGIIPACAGSTGFRPRTRRKRPSVCFRRGQREPDIPE